MGRQTSRSLNSRQPTNNSTVTNTNGDLTTQSSLTTNTNRNRSNSNRKSKSNNNECLISQESPSNSSHADTTIMSVLNDSSSNDMDDDIASPTISNTINNNSKKKSSKKSKTNNDIKACSELLKSDVSWPFQTPVDAKQHPEYYECIKNPMDFSTIKKKMRNNQYTKREEFLHDVELILNNCEYFNEDDSPVGQAGHLLRTFFQSQWTKQFG
ncbi:unnamed protein product [Rotaria sp. Silwood1]|nr:unnamed protein product [Rotaria sp. Silwood1]CAF3353499.1 unnamed protein product [Rotaria sp. Silwood1]CAF3377834.1 unnamed protein product [Rotaria sp. Silwood1]CAF4601575.1 unnamed protein product [Rotaria sp. Silwood1]CAF4677555.1 unnamed protein product [Rotaria sp. Silwood1]